MLAGLSPLRAGSNVFAWGLSLQGSHMLALASRVVPDYVKERVPPTLPMEPRRTTEYSANGSFFVPRAPPKRAHSRCEHCSNKKMVKPHG